MQLGDDENYRLWRESNLLEVGMLPSAEPRDVYRALTDYIVAESFSEGQWLRLADDIGERDGRVIETHPRLLRSLRWRDPDYEATVRSVVEQILGDGLEHLDHFVRNLVGFDEWLKITHPSRHRKLFGGGRVPTSARLEDQRLTTSGVRTQLQKLRELSADSDPDEIIGKAKNLVESASKCVLDRLSSAQPEDFPALVSAAFVAVGLNRKSPPGPPETMEGTRQMIQGLVSAATALGRLRNTGGDGHGPLEQLPTEELKDVAEMARDTAIGIATVLIHALERMY